MNLKLPTPLSMHLVIVGGDAKMHEIDVAWRAAFMLISTKLAVAPAGSLVLVGPQAGSPDALASDAVRYGNNHALSVFGRDGRVLSTANFSREKDVKAPYNRRYCGMWSMQPTPEGLSMELAHQSALSKAEGWGVDVFILHGWDGSFRGERLAECMRHLGVQPKEWDISKEGKVLER